MQVGMAGTTAGADSTDATAAAASGTLRRVPHSSAAPILTFVQR
jgi:hypothetical protein